MRAVCLSCFALAAACGSDKGAGGGSIGSPDPGACPVVATGGGMPQVLSNDSAEIDGPTFGQGTDPNDALHKVIRTDLLAPEPRLTLGPAHAMRTETDEYVDLAMSVTNA